MDYTQEKKGILFMQLLSHPSMYPPSILLHAQLIKTKIDFLN